MDVVFSTDDLPKRRLQVEATIADRFATDASRQITAMREKIAREIARKCAETDDLVKIDIDGPFVKVRADCIIMTTDELADLLRKKFRDGIEHASYFIPRGVA